MPETTPEIKVKAVKRLGGTVELIGESYTETQAYAQVCICHLQMLPVCIILMETRCRHQRRSSPQMLAAAVQMLQFLI